ncbi:hypothetical protein [Aestuariispira insulae]|uniref:Uncharacterized protein n=1 Tax=Aestuariispira insulae TaxID=1461337 RepID=A0A3D9HVJ1_9PROT|nr:hypothetical protein [Aestuariispira insulae]RED53534.1 hypothetical protein DFP90_101325 [Aestuariispira insulae]
MSDSPAEFFLLQAGKSPVLEQIFHAIADQDFDGRPRFREKECMELGRVIACRIYAKPMLELLHLVRAAALMDRKGAFETLFWEVIPATPTNFRDVICAKASSGRVAQEYVSVRTDGITLHYPGAEDFSIKFGRMPFLAILMDFLVNALGYVECAEVFQPVLSPDCSQKAVSDGAKEMARLVYRFLEDHLPTVQNQKKFRQIVTFLEEQYGPSFDGSEIDDACLLAFWREYSHLPGEESGNFTAFPTVFDGFVRFVQSLDHGKMLQAAGRAGVIGNDREMGEIDPDSAHQLSDFVVDEAMDPLERLMEPPLDRIKFLNKRETETLSYLLPRLEEVRRWRISYMRAEVFGRGQARISQALRNKMLADEFMSLLENAAVENYQDRLSAMEKVAGYLDKLMLAALYVVGRAQERDNETSTIDFAVMGKARKAFHSISRQGFQEELLDEPETAEAFEQAADCLAPVNGRFQSILELLQDSEDWGKIYEMDRPLFANQFRRIYGESA